VPLHPQAQVIVDAANAAPAIAPSDERLADIRAAYAMLLLVTGDPTLTDAPRELDADGVPVRVYAPREAPDLPVVVYFHSGGWTIGTAEQFDGIARLVARAADAIVVSVDYRLAPEHPFPAALDDAWNALNWVAKNAASFGGDATRLAVMGESAGGNLAAVCALAARDARTPNLALQVLVYPVCDCDFTTPSYCENGVGYLLSEQTMRWFFSCYVRGDTDPTDPRITPLHHRDVQGVAPALVITAEYDPLRDEGEAYARKLAEAGVPVHKRRFDGMIHQFFGMVTVLDDARTAVELVGTELRRAFGTLVG